MQKTVVIKPEIKLIGLTVVTNNQNESNSSTAKISSLVNKYFSENISSQIQHKKNQGVTFSVYTNYSSDEHGDYTYFIGEEVTLFESANNAILQTLHIPSANYVCFTTASGNMPEVVIKAWQEIWRMSAEDFGGKRTYIADFEIYDERANNPHHSIVDIYLDIK